MATAMNATSTFSCPHNGTAHDGTLLCHWSNSPGARGTLDILWLCISTLGLCVWNAVHPDVPRPRTPGWRVFGWRVWWLFVGLFMPEMLVLVALGQFRQAWKLLVYVDEKAVLTQFPWWMYLVKSWRPKNRRLDSLSTRWKKAMLRWMEFLLCLGVHPPSQGRDPLATASDVAVDERENGLPRPREHPWTLTHSFCAVMNGFVDDEGEPMIYRVADRLTLPPGDSERIAAMSVDGDGPRRIALLLGDPERITVDIENRASKTLLIWTSTTIAIDDVPRSLTLSPGDHSLIPAVSIGDDGPRPLALLFDNPQRIPDVSVEDIEDRGKAGVLAKSLLVWQLFVFLANCFARWEQSLPLSLLEITTIGHSLCSIIAMVLWWYKPHSVGEATVINRHDPLPSPSNVNRRKVFTWSFLVDSFGAGARKVLGSERSIDVPRTVTIAAIAVLYGLPHLLGLSAQFPTFAEQRCWEIATFMVIGSPLVMCCILWTFPYVEKLDDRIKYAVGFPLVVLIYILLVLYPVASMFLVGESVRQIFALPVESFREPQLTTYLPSFS